MNSIVLRREIAVSILERRWERSRPPAEAVIAISTGARSPSLSGFGMAPGDLLQGEAQRLGVGEFAVGEQQSAVLSAASSSSENLIASR